MSHTPQWLPKLFVGYCTALQEINRLDYGSLLYFAKKLLSENTGVTRLTRLAWRFVCVDEFQDTNRAQYDLVRMLVSPEKPNLFIVADDDQIIYQWNGASPERLLSLNKDFKMDIVQLPENFRCPPVIIQLANNLIKHNQTRTSGKMPLVAHKPAGESPVLQARIFKDELAEVSAISKPSKKQDGMQRIAQCLLAQQSSLREQQLS